MKELFIIILSFPLLMLQMQSCSAPRIITEGSDTSDSVRVEVRVQKEYIKDTVTVEIPPIFVEKEVRDTISRIERDNVSTVAKVGKDGTLYHTLDIRQLKKPVEILKPVERRDSIVDRQRAVTLTNVVEVPRDLTWWQRTQMYGFWIFVLITAFCFIIRRFFR